MTALSWLIPAALALGGMGLAAFLWCMQSGQFEDLDGAAWRALWDDGEDSPGEHADPAPQDRVKHEGRGPCSGGACIALGREGPLADVHADEPDGSAMTAR